jgi:hypothetical protein
MSELWFAREQTCDFPNSLGTWVLDWVWQRHIDNEALQAVLWIG